MTTMIMITKMKTTIKMITVFDNNDNDNDHKDDDNDDNDDHGNDDDDDNHSDEDGHLDVVTKSCKKRFSTHWSNLQSTSVKFCWEHFIAFDNMYFI